MTTLGELRNKFSAVHKQYNSTAFELSKKLNETKELIKRVPEGDKLFGTPVQCGERPAEDL